MTTDLRSVRRQLRRAIPGLPLADGSDSLTLEHSELPIEPPHTRACELLEGTAMLARRVAGEPVVGFGAFLDGIQASRVWYYDEGVPVVLGQVAAAIRVRIGRRLTLWRSVEESARFYVPFSHLSAGTREALESTGLEVVDTLQGSAGDAPPHPLQLTRLAYQAVLDARELIERNCAVEWARSGAAPLFVDGPVPRAADQRPPRWSVGVVKSHHTLYVGTGSIKTIASLGERERTAAFLIPSSWSDPVASWYLRVRTAPGRDPLWGLVRVEIALPPSGSQSILTEHVDLVSRWILAERSPLALPDGRWDRMPYGIRDVESYLRVRLQL
ncbi:MAG: hypothetical protein MNPFHGCM_01272 [Gemmatimonadaceae bacterium]|nr:hypothetical protein [Gemmatimonadaceae bacterium]